MIAQISNWFGDKVDLVAAPSGSNSSVVADISRFRRFIDGRPRLAIITPTFTRSALLREAVESALAQTVACEISWSIMGRLMRHLE